MKPSLVVNSVSDSQLNLILLLVLTLYFFLHLLFFMKIVVDQVGLTVLQRKQWSAGKVHALEVTRLSYIFPVNLAMQTDCSNADRLGLLNFWNLSSCSTMTHRHYHRTLPNKTGIVKACCQNNFHVITDTFYDSLPIQLFFTETGSFLTWISLHVKNHPRLSFF